MRRPTQAERLGTTPLLESIGKPAVNVDDPNLLQVAQAIVQNIPPNVIFRRDNDYFTVTQSPTQDETGLYSVHVTRITPGRLRTWLCNHLMFYKGTGDKAKAIQMPKQLAETLMESDPWYWAMNELETVIPVLLPVWGPVEEGKRTITLSAPGYHPETRSYIAETLNYTANTPQYKPAACRKAWDSLMHTFPWGAESTGEQLQQWTIGGPSTAGEPGAESGKPGVNIGPRPCTNRSACCCLALMLGQYCRLLIDDVMPIGIFNANQPGSAKSLLAWICVSPVWGMASGTPDPKSEDDAIKALQAAVLDKAAYYILDDIPVLASGTINMFATSNEVSGRRLGGLETFRARNKMQIFATGNNIGTSEDIERRALICDLFLATKAIKRTFSHVLNKKIVSEPAWRADLLRLMWSMVRNWADQGCPILVDNTAKPTFENFANVVGSIMLANGFQSPFRDRQYSGSGGDLIGRTVNRLLAYIATHRIPAGSTSATFKLSEIIEIAQANDWLNTIVGAAKSAAHSMGKRLESLRAQKLFDENGLPYEFGKREGAGQSSYTFTRLADPSQYNTQS